ncbi:IPTL-CTERM sorting domain-containing protein [Diaphorobacter sp. HDW4A]|uniref:IPTL-CTERM sorting domain-containing protein n=1 Tax=Diaphorobacter sp. HDW4A TaxID=2714924 RepID=UPI00140A14B8|nr:IPTL-CTERM sorting domain-containing protein [Diaphorobacter sp. HDW4A]QIL82005.1 IPTL-CTERM sorting domain-containing protein [Diaphorobacter sp. HDW4A]
MQNPTARLRLLPLALCSMTVAFGAHAASYTVPPGATKLQVTLNGAGGGAGGADLNGGGGVGANGVSLQVEFAVEPGQVLNHQAGTGGLSGYSWEEFSVTKKPPQDIPGGVGGTGGGNGGRGGAAPLANFNPGEGWGPSNPDPDSASGGGGGGGGASFASITTASGTLWARAAGGGGGGGGSWSRNASTIVIPAGSPVEAGDCNNAANGVDGEPGSGTRSSPNRGGGGGGGSGGGYLVPGVTVAPAAAGWDGAGADVDGGHQGAPGASCYSTGIGLLAFSAIGGGVGSSTPPSSSDGNSVPAPAASGTDGSVSVVPVIEPIVPVSTAGDSSGKLDATLPPSIKPSDVVSYSYTCTPQLGSMANPVETATLPLTVTGLTNDQAYQCTVVAKLTNPNDQSTYTTPISVPTTFTPKAGATNPPGGSGTQAVPTLGEWAAIGLSSLMALTGLIRVRRRRI